MAYGLKVKAVLEPGIGRQFGTTKEKGVLQGRFCEQYAGLARRAVSVLWNKATHPQTSTYQ